jgi:hypothetical protein
MQPFLRSKPTPTPVKALSVTNNRKHRGPAVLRYPEHLPDQMDTCHVLIYDMIYILTAIGLSPGGSTHLHTNTT